MGQRLNNTQHKGTSASSLVSRNITVNGRRTSVRLEPEMWGALREIATREQCSVHDLCGLVSALKGEDSSLTAAIRVFLMLYYKSATTDEGHNKAGHGNISYMMERVNVIPSGRTTRRKNRDISHGQFAKTQDGYYQDNRGRV